MTWPLACVVIAAFFMTGLAAIVLSAVVLTNKREKRQHELEMHRHAHPQGPRSGVTLTQPQLHTLERHWKEPGQPS